MRSLSISVSGSLSRILFTTAVTLTSAASAFAADTTHELFKYRVFAKESIQATLSDFDGKAAAGKSIQLSNFLVVGDLRATEEVGLFNVTVRGQVQAARVNSTNSQMRSRKQNSDFARQALLLSSEMDQISRHLALLTPNTKPVYRGNQVEITTLGNGQPTIVELSADDLYDANLQVTGSASDTVVINFKGMSGRIYAAGFFLNGGISADNMIFNFPEATTLQIARSGAPPSPKSPFGGVPATIVAPHADLSFHQASVPGGVYVRNIFIDARLPYGTPSGQVNPGCFQGSAVGIGCTPEVPPVKPVPAN